MDRTRRMQLIKQRSLEGRMLSRIQNFIEAGDQKINDIQLRFNKLPVIFNRNNIAQSQLELLEDTDHTGVRELSENQYYQVEERYSKILHPLVDQPSIRSSLRSSGSRNSNHTPRSHKSSTHIKPPTIALPTSEGDTCSWLHYRDTFETIFVNNKILSNVQKIHYHIASLKNEAKVLIRNLKISIENLLVAWPLLTQRCNNKRLIAMMHPKHICQMPQVRNGGVSTLRQLCNHVSSHMNALKALSMNEPVQDLMLNDLSLATLDPETQREWELLTASRADTQTTAELVIFLESICRFLERLQTTLSMKVVPNNLRPSDSNGNKVSKTYSNIATQLQCSLCNGSHRLFKCDKFLKMQARQHFHHVKESGLQLLATIYQKSQMFEASLSSVLQETSYLAGHRQATSIE